MADRESVYSPFVKAVAGDGTTPPDVRVLKGWLGASGEEGFVRLYLDLELSTYVDIPSDAVLYSEGVPDSHPAGERHVWVPRNAELKEGGSAIARASKFLFGEVQRDFLGGARQQQPQAGGAAVQIPETKLCLTFKPGCERTGFTGQCESSLNPCITVTEMPQRCLTRMPGCEHTGFTGNCESSLNPCITVTEVSQRCLTRVPGCEPTGFTGNCESSLNPCITVTEMPQRCLTRIPCSAIDACPSSLGCTFDTTIVQQQQRFALPQVNQPFAPQQVGIRPPAQVTSFCPQFPTAPAGCPAATMVGCPPQSVICGGGGGGGGNPSHFGFCPLAQPMAGPTFGGCASAIDACPSSLGCTFDTTIFQQQQQRFAQPQAFASGPGWTCVCPPQHTIYPQCPTGHTGCVTFPCWAAQQQPFADVNPNLRTLMPVPQCGGTVPNPTFPPNLPAPAPGTGLFCTRVSPCPGFPPGIRWEIP